MKGTVSTVEKITLDHKIGNMPRIMIKPVSSSFMRKMNGKMLAEGISDKLV